MRWSSAAAPDDLSVGPDVFETTGRFMPLDAWDLITDVAKPGSRGRGDGVSLCAPLVLASRLPRREDLRARGRLMSGGALQDAGRWTTWRPGPTPNSQLDSHANSQSLLESAARRVIRSALLSADNPQIRSPRADFVGVLPGQHSRDLHNVIEVVSYPCG